VGRDARRPAGFERHAGLVGDLGQAAGLTTASGEAGRRDLRLDGTLADTLPACYAAFRAACEGLDGPTYTNEEIRGLFGPSEEGMLQRAMPERWEAGLTILLAEYQRHLNLCSGVFPSVTTALQLLRERRTPLALVTGKGPFTTKMSLTHFGLDGVFDPVEVGSPQGVVKAAAIARVVARWVWPPRT
jgi:pyrophosphatase PpaX